MTSDEREAFAQALRDFAQRECGSREQRDRLTDGGRETHNPELYGRLAERGYHAVGLPEAHGGAGGGLVDTCVLMEEIAFGQVPVFGLGTTLIVAACAGRFGDEKQRERILGGIRAGAVKAIAMSEPQAGSDLAGIRCRARPGPGAAGGYVINGQKTWISNAAWADEILVVCRTGEAARGHDGLTMLLVPRTTPGVEIRPIATMGGREVSDVFLQDVRVGADALIGTEGRAWGQLMSGLDFERVALAASILGSGRRAFADALAYVRDREQFGRPVGSFQALKHRIADLATELECSRLLVHGTAAAVDADPEANHGRVASMAKLKVTETARRVALDGMQMMGAAGCASEYEMEHHVRKLLVSTVYGGTSEIQREIIAGSLGL